jgi:hypothetical protein
VDAGDVAGFVAWKVAQMGLNAVAAITPGIQLAVNISRIRAAHAEMGLAAAHRTSAAAIAQNTATTAANIGANVGMLARIRGAAATVGHTIATTASSLAMKAAAAGQWLLNAALPANPIGIVIALIALLVGGPIWFCTQTELGKQIRTNVWNGITGIIGWVWEHGIKPVFQALGDFITKTVPKALEDGIAFIKTIWEGLQEIAKAPIRFIVNTVLNDGLIGAFNTVAGFLGAGKMDKISIPGFERGGWTGPGRSDKPAGIVHADEFVIPKHARRNMERNHSGALSHIMRQDTLAGHEGGGRVKPLKDLVVTQGYNRVHKGIDYAAAIGTPVFASQDGLVSHAGPGARAPGVWGGNEVHIAGAGIGLPAAPRDPVQVLVSDGTTDWVQFTGVIDETSGDVGGLPQSTIIDTTDRLNRPFSFGALLRVMPPVTPGAPDYRGIGLTAQYPADQALRTCGFYSTPETESNPALSVPAQTSMWPDGGNAGTLILGGSADGVGSHALNEGAPWGWSVGNFNCTYTPRLANPGTTTAVQLTVLVAADHTGSMTFDVVYGATTLRLMIDTGRSAVVMLNGGELGRLSLGTDTIVTSLIEGGAWTLRKVSGAQVTGTVTVPAEAMTSVHLFGDAPTRCAGFQVSHPSTAAHRFASLRHVPSATVDTSYLTGITDALPAVDTTARSVLEEISKATLTPYWIDGSGTLRAVGSWELRAQEPAQTVTTLDDIQSLSWADALLGQRSGVQGAYDLPAIIKGCWPNTTLYQGSGEKLEPGQELEQFIEPAADEAWIQVDTSLETAGVDPAAFNSAHGSFSGGVYQDNATGATTSAGAYITTARDLVKGGTYKLTIVVGAIPAGTKALLKTKDLTTYHPDKRESASR